MSRIITIRPRADNDNEGSAWKNEDEGTTLHSHLTGDSGEYIYNSTTYRRKFSVYFEDPGLTPEEIATIISAKLKWEMIHVNSNEYARCYVGGHICWQEYGNFRTTAAGTWTAQEAELEGTDEEEWDQYTRFWGDIDSTSGLESSGNNTKFRNMRIEIELSGGGGGDGTPPILLGDF